jgi:hypothetical protein
MPHPFRALLCALALVPLLAPSGAVAQKARKIDLATPEGVLLANRKIHCSAKDNVPATYWWHGDLYARVPGERDRLLFKVEGMNVRQCVAVDDPANPGFKLVSRELLFYRDPQTGELARKWKNPWTGEEVDVIQTANDPVNSTWRLNGRDGKTPMKWTGSQQGDMWWITTTVPLFYTNPLGGEYQQYVGGMYHATEMFNFFGDVEDLLDARKDSAETRVGWVRVSGWLPWMKMGDRVGTLYFHTAGRKLARWDDMPERMKQDIAREFPLYRAPPGGDDPRPNETSWTYFKKQVKPEAAKSGH